MNDSHPFPRPNKSQFMLYLIPLSVQPRSISISTHSLLYQTPSISSPPYHSPPSHSYTYSCGRLYLARTEGSQIRSWVRSMEAEQICEQIIITTKQPVLALHIIRSNLYFIQQGGFLFQANLDLHDLTLLRHLDGFQDPTRPSLITGSREWAVVLQTVLRLETVTVKQKESFIGKVGSLLPRFMQSSIVQSLYRVGKHIVMGMRSESEIFFHNILSKQSSQVFNVPSPILQHSFSPHDPFLSELEGNFSVSFLGGFLLHDRLLLTQCLIRIKVSEPSVGAISLYQFEECEHKMDMSFTVRHTIIGQFCSITLSGKGVLYGQKSKVKFSSYQNLLESQLIERASSEEKILVVGRLQNQQVIFHKENNFAVLRNGSRLQSMISLEHENHIHLQNKLGLLIPQSPPLSPTGNQADTQSHQLFLHLIKTCSFFEKNISNNHQHMDSIRVASFLYKRMLNACLIVISQTYHLSLIKQHAYRRVKAMQEVLAQDQLLFQYVRLNRMGLVLGIREGFLTEKWFSQNLKAIQRDIFDPILNRARKPSFFEPSPDNLLSLITKQRPDLIDTYLEIARPLPNKQLIQPLIHARKHSLALRSLSYATTESRFIFQQLKEMDIGRQAKALGTSAEIISLCSCNSKQFFQNGFLRRYHPQFYRVVEFLHTEYPLDVQPLEQLGNLDLSLQGICKSVSEQLDRCEKEDWSKIQEKVKELSLRLLEASQSNLFVKIKEKKLYFDNFWRISQIAQKEGKQDQLWDKCKPVLGSELYNVRFCKDNFALLREHSSIFPSQLFIHLVNQSQFKKASQFTSDIVQIHNIVYYLLNHHPTRINEIQQISQRHDISQPLAKHMLAHANYQKLIKLLQQLKIKTGWQLFDLLVGMGMLKEARLEVNRIQGESGQRINRERAGECIQDLDQKNAKQWLEREVR